MANLRPNASVSEHLNKMQRLVFQATVVFNATPADKAHICDIPGGVFLRSEGKTAQCDAVEDLAAQVPTADDGTGVFALLIDDQVEKIYSAAATADSGTVTVASEISTDGRLILEFDSSLDLSTTSLTLTITVEYKAKSN